MTMTAQSAPTKWQSVKTLNRSDLTKRLVARLTREEAVVGGIGNTNFDLFAAGHRPQNFYMLGSMGLACPIALGVALAQPQRGVIALEGDGSILMALGCLTTIGMIQPKNLTIVIMDNGLYQITGSQKTATNESADIVAIAQGAGIENAVWARDEGHFEQLIDRRFDESGPVLIAAKIDNQPAVAQTVRDPFVIRNRFLQGLGTGRRSPLDI
jgi:thiamine pyrophosphate-dependent acetolactate synthase large subunit-like protein